MQRFLVFKCPKCGAFLYAPINQKTRRCTYCNHIIKINPNECQIANSIEEASKLVKKYNASKNTDEFIMAVEASRDSIREIYDYLNSQSSSASSRPTEYISGGKSRTFWSLLVKFAKVPISLDKFREITERHKLDWLWVSESLEKLAQDGVIIFPRPWEILLVSDDGLPGIKEENNKGSNRKSSKSLERLIVEFLEAHNMPIKKSEIIREIEKYGFESQEIQKSLDKMKAKGIIYEPKIEWISLV